MSIVVIITKGPRTGGAFEDAVLVDGAGALLDDPVVLLGGPVVLVDVPAVPVVPVIPVPAGGAAVEGGTKSEVPDPIPSPSLNSMPSYKYSSETVPDDENEAFDPSLASPLPLPSPPTVAEFTTNDPDPNDDDDPKVDNNRMRLLLANFLASDPLHSSSDSHFSTHAHPFPGSCEHAL
jgi:hypothetical protein